MISNYRYTVVYDEYKLCKCLKKLLNNFDPSHQLIINIFDGASSYMRIDFCPTKAVESYDIIAFRSEEKHFALDSTMEVDPLRHIFVARNHFESSTLLEQSIMNILKPAAEKIHKEYYK